MTGTMKIAALLAFCMLLAGCLESIGNGYSPYGYGRSTGYADTKFNTANCPASNSPSAGNFGRESLQP